MCCWRVDPAETLTLAALYPNLGLSRYVWKYHFQWKNHEITIFLGLNFISCTFLKDFVTQNNSSNILKKVNPEFFKVGKI